MKVIKRNGTEVDFKRENIVAAINKANNNVLPNERISEDLITTIINTPRSYFNTTLVVGTAAVFIVQMSLNVFGSCNLIPFTGVTLPFISNGGSSMLSCGILAGFLKAGQANLFYVPPKPVPQQANAVRRANT